MDEEKIRISGERVKIDFPIVSPVDAYEYAPSECMGFDQGTGDLLLMRLPNHGQQPSAQTRVVAPFPLGGARRN